MPADLFNDPLLSQTVLDEEFQRSRGELCADALGRASVDSGLYGSDHQSTGLFEEGRTEIRFVTH